MLDSFKTIAPEHDQKDVEKRINIMFDQMNQQKIPNDVIESLSKIAKGIYS
jgi:hypothetical protein